MLVYPCMFHVWVTKTVSHFCGSNLQLARFKESTTDACPCCGTSEESAAHITRCMNPGFTEVFVESVSLFIEWLHETHMQEDLISCIESYLLSRGDKPMVAIASHLPRYASLARDVDALGWECFLEGRIPTSLVTLQCAFLRRSESFWKIRTWSSHCVQYLLNITHRQWLYRNAHIHIRSMA